MNKKKDGEFRSKVYEMRPEYADYESEKKFEAIRTIIISRLLEHPNACCSYSGGSDSDILLHLIETCREQANLPSVKYFFFETGIEMEATRRHVKEMSIKYGVEIETIRPKKNIVIATREYGVPFMSKIVSAAMNSIQKKNVPLSIRKEYESADDKHAIRAELKRRYPNAEQAINFICCCNSNGDPRPDIQLVVDSSAFLYDFLCEFPPDFEISAKCCDYCKKAPAHEVQKDYEMIITGERRDEGGMRSVPKKGEENATMCFSKMGEDQFRLKPLFYVSNKDKEWYKITNGIKYSDAYEVYGLTRTGCCGCSISSKAVSDLEKIGEYEPNLKKAAYSVFGKSYEYRRKYNEYKKKRREELKDVGKK